jgi:hypothetical protein
MIVNARTKDRWRRARMMREADGDLLLADDDSYPEQVDCLPKLSDFEDRPLLAVLHFPPRTDSMPKHWRKQTLARNI